MAADYKKKVGFKGTLLLEPKPQVSLLRPLGYMNVLACLGISCMVRIKGHVSYAYRTYCTVLYCTVALPTRSAAAAAAVVAGIAKYPPYPIAQEA
jgi:hypothetical protein